MRATNLRRSVALLIAHVSIMWLEMAQVSAITANSEGDTVPYDDTHVIVARYGTSNCAKFGLASFEQMSLLDFFRAADLQLDGADASYTGPPVCFDGPTVDAPDTWKMTLYCEGQEFENGLSLSPLRDGENYYMGFIRIHVYEDADTCVGDPTMTIAHPEAKDYATCAPASESPLADSGYIRVFCGPSANMTLQATKMDEILINGAPAPDGDAGDGADDAPDGGDGADDAPDGDADDDFTDGSDVDTESGGDADDCLEDCNNAQALNCDNIVESYATGCASDCVDTFEHVNGMLGCGNSGDGSDVDTESGGLPACASGCTVAPVDCGSFYATHADGGCAADCLDSNVGLAFLQGIGGELGCDFDTQEYVSNLNESSAANSLFRLGATLCLAGLLACA